jgi:hypothetical protein
MSLQSLIGLTQGKETEAQGTIAILLVACEAKRRIASLRKANIWLKWKFVKGL